MGLVNLLLNVFIILLAVFVYFGLHERIPAKYHKCFLGLLLVIATALCMAYPFKLISGHVYDLRIIVILISILYGGYGIGLTVTIFAFVLRYFIGGMGFLHMLISFPAVLIVAFYIYHRFNYYGRLKKIIVALLLDFTLVSINIALIFLFGQFITEQILFFVNYSLLHAAGMCMMVYLIEILKENKLMREKIQRSVNNQVLGELAASFAHEIRNPLTTTFGFAQLLKMSEIDQHKMKYIDMILSESKRAETIISEYLSFAKPQIENIENVNANKIIDHVTDIVSSYALLNNIDLIKSMDETLLIHTDPKKLTQVLINIMKNNIEAMTESGGVLVVKAKKENSKVVIQISDTGKGMTKEQIKRLGTPFYSTKEKGTGIGMMVVYRYLELINGNIHVESEVGKGTEVTLVFPAC